jgi:hypothetical protein
VIDVTANSKHLVVAQREDDWWRLKLNSRHNKKQRFSKRNKRCHAKQWIALRLGGFAPLR